jgi:polygalacturonase
MLITRQSIAADAPVILRPNIPDRTFNITDYGAVADGVTLNTAAIARTIEACEKAGGGTVRVPAGKFLTAAFSLASNLNFHLDKGAILLLSNRFSDYPLEARDRYPNLITASDCHDLAITGEGTIDGQGEPWWTEFLKTKNAPADAPHMAHRPFMIVIKGCTRLLVQGVTLTNSPSFHLVPQQCTDVTIDHVTILAPEKAPNTDGMDPSGWNYSITHCTFDVGDDCIAIKAGGKASGDKPSCENFFISDCTFKHGHGMSIGGQTGAGLKHLVVQNCTFDSTGAGIRMKAPRGNGGLVEDCLYENLTMTNVKYPIYITSYYPESTAPKSAAADPAKPVDAMTPIWRNIRIRNLTATKSPYAGRIIGLAEMPISNLEFDNVNISAEKGMDVWNVKGLRFVNCKITVAKGNMLDVQQSSGVTGLDGK